jgi:hypothetical protein
MHQNSINEESSQKGNFVVEASSAAFNFFRKKITEVNIGGIDVLAQKIASPKRQQQQFGCGITQVQPKEEAMRSVVS